MDAEVIQFMDYFYQILEIESAIFTADGCCVYHTNCELHDRGYLWEELREQIKEKSKEAMPYIYEVEENIYAWIIHDTQPEKRIYIFGPVGTRFLTAGQKKAFEHKRHLKEGNVKLPLFRTEKFVPLMGLSSGGVCKQYFENSVIQKNQSKFHLPGIKEKADYDLYRLKESKERVPYELELQWLKSIERGTLEEYDTKLLGKRRADELIGDVGTMATESEYKQMEYTLIASITLATRAAIAGGVPPMAAYETSDLLLQQASRCRNLMQLVEMNQEMLTVFVDLVNRFKQEKQQGALVELCKNYVAKHIYQKFTIQEMADALSVNRSYLSRKFTEKTGKTIREFILEERLAASANLLKFSNESVSQIADYMQFSSAGRFSAYFRKQYGVTPTQYREENKIIDFVEKK